MTSIKIYKLMTYKMTIQILEYCHSVFPKHLLDNKTAKQLYKALGLFTYV